MSTADATRDATAEAAETAHGAQSLAGKYMTFKLADEEYGLAILMVREIIGLMDIKHVPCTSEFISGVINLRGKVIPVVDLRLKFGMPKATVTDQTVIIVVQPRDGEMPIGCVVDEALGVLQLAEEQIEPPPDLGAHPDDTAFILGVGKAERRVIFLLDLRSVLASSAAVADTSPRS